MLVLKELLDVADEISLFKKDLFQDTFTEKEKYFLHQLKKDEKTKEDVLREDIFGENTKNAPFRKLKLSIRGKLQSILHFYVPHPNKLNKFQRAYYKVNNIHSTVTILLGKQKRKAAIELSKSGLSLGMKYGFTLPCIEFSRILCNHHLRFTGQTQLANDYQLICDDYINQLSLEIKAENYYSQLINFYTQTQEVKAHVAPKAKSFYEELKPELQKIASPKFHTNAFLVGIVSCLAKNDFENTKKIAYEALDYFESLPFDHKFARIIFINHLTNCHIQLSELEEAEARLNEALQIVSKGTTQWFRTQELLLLVKFRLGKYSEAEQIQVKISNSDQLSFQLNSLKNRWHLYHIYINLLKLFGKLDLQKSMKMKSILYTIPEFSSDKRAMNIPLLIGQLLLFIHEKDYEQIEIRLSALSKYCGRYLKKENNYRSNCFIKMLLEVPIRNFHPSAIQRHASKYYQKLLAVPINEANQPLEIEIIPYEDLWEIIMEYLSKTRFKTLSHSFKSL